MHNRIVIIFYCLSFASAENICDEIKMCANQGTGCRMVFCNQFSTYLTKGQPPLCARSTIGNTLQERITHHTVSRVYAFFHYLKIAGELYTSVPNPSGKFEEIKATQFQDYNAQQNGVPAYTKIDHYETQCGGPSTSSIWTNLEQIPSHEHSMHAAHLVGFSIIPKKNSGVLNNNVVNDMFCTLSIANAYTENMPALINLNFDKVIDDWQFKTASDMLQNPQQFNNMIDSHFIKTQVPELIIKFNDRIRIKRNQRRNTVYVAIAEYIVNDLQNVLGLSPSRSILQVPSLIDAVVTDFRKIVK